MKMAGIRKYGKTTLFTDINRSGGIHWGKTHATVMIAAKKPASEVLTACSDQLKKSRSSRHPFQSDSGYDLGNQSEWKLISGISIRHTLRYCIMESERSSNNCHEELPERK